MQCIIIRYLVAFTRHYLCMLPGLVWWFFCIVFAMYVYMRLALYITICLHCFICRWLISVGIICVLCLYEAHIWLRLLLCMLFVAKHLCLIPVPMVKLLSIISSSVGLKDLVICTTLVVHFSWSFLPTLGSSWCALFIWGMYLIVCPVVCHLYISASFF